MLFVCSRTWTFLLVLAAACAEQASAGRNDVQAAADGVIGGDIDCTALAAESCEQRQGCFALFGYLATDPTAKSVYAACLPKDRGCYAITVCALESASGDCFVFGSGCWPPGWETPACSDSPCSQ